MAPNVAILKLLASEKCDISHSRQLQTDRLVLPQNVCQHANRLLGVLKKPVRLLTDVIAETEDEQDKSTNWPVEQIKSLLSYPSRLEVANFWANEPRVCCTNEWAISFRFSRDTRLRSFNIRLCTSGSSGHLMGLRLGGRKA